MREEIIFFVDRCLGGKKISGSLRALGIRVEVHDDHFAKDALDTDWLPQVASRGWVVITKDKMIGKRNLEILAVVESGARLFVLVLKTAGIDEIITTCEKALPKMIKFTEENEAPFMAKVYRDGTVQTWKDSDDLKKRKDELLGKNNI